MSIVLNLVRAPWVAWKRDPMVWGLVYSFLVELTGAAVLMLSILSSGAYNEIYEWHIYPAITLAVLGLLVLLCSCGEYYRTDAWGGRR